MYNEIRVLDQQIAELSARREALFQSKRQEAVQLARALVQQFQLTPAQVQLSSLSRSRAPVKLKRPATFYDPNRGLSWDGTVTGPGRKPDWIKAAIEDGTIEFFRIQVQSATSA
ncbi:H-NS histone family protein [Curvibacter sp. HBC61]|uniref:H-NS histone family protein n=1 Tax=Curvibacter cyanobacteriorum TaxID=3026422 RepID=A0ABT5MVR3_9BURK|nr:H-NS histone family protein [Curvibacter sp. HBC61]MDD0837995.1 H-NS histone family protein [Curvibacter sp. HBC61]